MPYFKHSALAVASLALLLALHPASRVTKVAAAHYSGEQSGEWALVLSSEGNVYSFGDCRSRNLGTGETVCSLTNCKAGAGPSGGGSIRCSADSRHFKVLSLLALLVQKHKC